MFGVLVFLFGLLWGSFLNVCIYRLPREESLVHPRSRCPHCKHTVVWYDNIPLLSYLWLRARCRHCAGPISMRYPLVELFSAILIWGLWWRWQESPAWFLAAYAAAAILLVVALIDWDTFLIPDVLSLTLLVGGILASPWNPYFSGGIARSLGSGLLGAVSGFLICFGIAALGEWMFKKEAMGGGDVKLLAAVGAWTGALGAFDCLMLASIFGAIYGVALIIRGKIQRQDPIPFGPFLSAAAIFNLFYLLPFDWIFTGSLWIFHRGA